MTIEPKNFTEQTLYLDPLTRDLAVNDAGDFDFKYDAECVAEVAKMNCLQWLGEDWLATETGVDYRGTILLGESYRDIFESGIRDTILQTTGVVAIQSFSSAYDASLKKLSWQANILTVYGNARVVT